MISETEMTPKSELQDLAQPQQELTPDEAAEVKGGFNPQPDPPCRWSSAPVISANPVLANPQITTQQTP